MSSCLEEARQRLAELRTAAPPVADPPSVLRTNEEDEETPRVSVSEHLRSNEGNEVSPAGQWSDRRCLVCGVRLVLGGLWYF
jgi:hypothetical protein